MTRRAASKEVLPQPRSLPDQIAEHLAEAILRGQFSPGQPIIEQDVADMFGVSRGPVREAFRFLEKEGVLVINPRRSVHVTRLTLEEVAELFQIRAALFALACGLCAERNAEIEMAKIEAAHKNVLRFATSSKRSAEAYSDVAAEAARVITGECGNQRLTEMLNRLGRQIQRYSLLGLSSPERRTQSIDSFGRLIGAIRAGDAAKAEMAGREMVKNTGNYAARMLTTQLDTSDQIAARGRKRVVKSTA